MRWRLKRNLDLTTLYELLNSFEERANELGKMHPAYPIAAKHVKNVKSRIERKEKNGVWRWKAML